MWRLIGVTFVLWLLVADATGAAVTNGDFESPALGAQPLTTYLAPSTAITGWTLDQGSAGLFTSAMVTAAHGTQAALMNDFGPGSIYQDVATIPGTRYVLSFAYTADPQVVPSEPGCTGAALVKRIVVDFGAQDAGTFVADANGHTAQDPGWIRVRRIVTAMQATTRLRFTSLHQGHCGPFLDDVALTPAVASDTQTTVTASRTPSVWGEPVTFTATVIRGMGAPPAGTIAFKIDGAAVASVPLDANGKASFTAPSPTVGDHTVAAAFQPSGPGVDASQGQLVQSVAKADATTTLAASQNVVVAGQVTTFTASLHAVAPSAATPTGTVQFTASGAPIGPPQPVSDGQAHVFALGGAGSYLIRAQYSGDSGFNASSSLDLSQTVLRANTATSIGSSSNPVAPGAEITFVILVETLAPGDVQAAGTVHIEVDGFDISGPLPLFDVEQDLTGVAVTFTAPDEPGANAIRAVYGGDQNTNASASPSYTQTIAAPTGPTGPTGPATPAAPATPNPVATSPATPPATAVATPRATVTKALLDALTAPLVQALKRKGFAALRGVAEPFQAPVPGTLKQQVSTVGQKAVVLATASHTFTTPGASTLRLKLTAAGRRTLRRAKQLKVEVVTRFAPLKGTPVGTSRRLAVTAHPRALSSAWRLELARAAVARTPAQHVWPGAAPWQHPTRARFTALAR